MARDIAVAALVAFSAGVMSGVIVTTALAIRSKGGVIPQSACRSIPELRVRRLMGTSIHGSSADPDS